MLYSCGIVSNTLLVDLATTLSRRNRAASGCLLSIYRQEQGDGGGGRWQNDMYDSNAQQVQRFW